MDEQVSTYLEYVESGVLRAPLNKHGELLRTVTEFRDGILNGAPSDLMCFAVCAPLQSYLHMCGTDTALIHGEFEGWMNHVWLEMEDGQIIDPTFDQITKWINKPLPPVYIGPKPDWYPDESPMD